MLCRGQLSPLLMPFTGGRPCNTYISEMFYKVKMHETCALRVRTVNLLSFHCYCYCCCYYCCCLFVFHKRAFCILCSVCSARCRLPHSKKVFAKMFSLKFPPQSRSRTRLRLRLHLCVSRLLLHVQLQQEQEQQLQMATHFRHLQHFLLATIVCQVAAAATAAPSVSSISNRTRCAVPLQLCC